jgi:hypothetical protein
VPWRITQQIEAEKEWTLSKVRRCPGKKKGSEGAIFIAFRWAKEAIAALCIPTDSLFRRRDDGNSTCSLAGKVSVGVGPGAIVSLGPAKALKMRLTCLATWK